MSPTPKTLTNEESTSLLQSLLGLHTEEKPVRKGIRNYGIGVVMLDTGLRVGEAVGLKVTDLWFRDEPVAALVVNEIIAKNHHERIIPVSTRLCAAIKLLHKSYWHRSPELSSYFAFESATHGMQLTTRQVERIIRQAAMKVLGRPIHPHILRHTFASRLMRVTNMRTVQELLGHKNISSTQIYTHPNGDDLKSAIDQLDNAGHEYMNDRFGKSGQ